MFTVNLWTFSSCRGIIIPHLIFGGILLKVLDRAVARFCYKHPRFGINNLMLYIVGGNIIVYLLYLMDRTGMLLQYLLFSPELIFRGQVWRLVSFIFIPSSSSPIMFAISLYFYYFIGSSLERQWGKGRFTIYYFSGLILNIIFGFVVHFCGYPSAYIGITSYYINMSMFFAFAALWPEQRVLLMFIIPIKIKWLAYIDAAMFLYDIFAGFSNFPLNLEPAVAILTFLLFCGSDLFSYIFHRRPYRSPNVINFRKAAKKYSTSQTPDQSAPKYRHKCEVCGRTDAEYPDLEFRYCSRCEGYHCFCQDHINNHVHFKE